MSLSHISFSLELIAIALGASFIIWALRTEGPGTAFAKIIGIIIIVLAVFDLSSTINSTVLYSNFAYTKYSSGMPNMQQHQMKSCCMGTTCNQECCSMMQEHKKMPAMMPTHTQPNSTMPNTSTQTQSNTPSH